MREGFGYNLRGAVVVVRTNGEKHFTRGSLREGRNLKLYTVLSINNYCKNSEFVRETNFSATDSKKRLGYLTCILEFQTMRVE